MSSSPHSSDATSGRAYPRSLSVSEWPDADRRAWEEACRPSLRLKPGGVARHLAEVSRNDFARRYGAFLGFLRRNDRLEPHPGAATQVTLPNVEAPQGEGWGEGLRSLDSSVSPSPQPSPQTEEGAHRNRCAIIDTHCAIIDTHYETPLRSHRSARSVEGQ